MCIFACSHVNVHTSAWAHSHLCMFMCRIRLCIVLHVLDGVKDSKLKIKHLGIERKCFLSGSRLYIPHMQSACLFLEERDIFILQGSLEKNLNKQVWLSSCLVH